MKRLLLVVFLITISIFLYAQEAMTIDSSGNIGIGQESSGERLEVNGRIKDETGFVTPVGSVVAYIGTTAPDGWLICNGLTDLTADPKYADLISVLNASNLDSTKTPDLRGIFVRGAGTNGTMKMANNSPFNGGRVGKTQEDLLQGHSHSLLHRTLGRWGKDDKIDKHNKNGAYDVKTGDVIDGHSSYGRARVGTETRPANMALNYIIKY